MEKRSSRDARGLPESDIDTGWSLAGLCRVHVGASRRDRRRKAVSAITWAPPPSQGRQHRMLLFGCDACCSKAFASTRSHALTCLSSHSRSTRPLLLSWLRALTNEASLAERSSPPAPNSIDLVRPALVNGSSLSVAADVDPHPRSYPSPVLNLCWPRCAAGPCDHGIRVARSGRPRRRPTWMDHARVDARRRHLRLTRTAVCALLCRGVGGLHSDPDIRLQLQERRPQLTSPRSTPPVRCCSFVQS